MLATAGILSAPDFAVADTADENREMQPAVQAAQSWILGSVQPFGLLVMPEMVKLPPLDKKFFLKATAGYQYDTNVILNAEGAPVPPDIGKKSDWRGVLNLAATYFLLKDPRGDVAFNYAFFYSDHNELKDFNLIQNLAELAARYKVNDSFAVRYSAVYQHLLLGTKLFDYAFMTGPSFIATWSKTQTTALDLRYRSTDYRNVAVFQANADRTGENYSGALTHSMSLSPAMLLRAGYSYDQDFARTTLWDGTGHRANIEGNFLLPRDTLLNLYGEYYQKEYEGVYASINAQRTDRAWSGVITLTTYYAERYGLSLRYLYTRNYSNVPAFDISRTIEGVLFDARF